MEAFVKGTRDKVRFTVVLEKKNATIRATTEDLWDVSIPDLDKLCVSLDEEVTKSATKSFIKVPTAANAEAKLKFEIAKYILDVKIAEVERDRKSRELKKKRQEIAELIADKENEKMKGKSIEELQAELLALEEA